jgi:outer membrane lipoprotein-sorting protein
LPPATDVLTRWLLLVLLLLVSACLCSGLKTSVGKIIEGEKNRLQQEGADEEQTAR